MKNKLQLLSAFALLAIGFANAQVGVGTTTPHASSVLDVSSTTKGFLPPRLTAEQRNAIASPAAGLTIFNTTTNCLNFFTGTGWNEDCGKILPPTFVSITGREWMDRNLGATQVATIVTDHLAYGDLYQWGRNADGHQKITWTSGATGTPANVTTATKSVGDQAANPLFITNNVAPGDWRLTPNDNLWQGVAGINNPCPSGFRVPTSAEFDEERTAYGITNSATAFASPFKFANGGYRNVATGALASPSSLGSYWTSTVSGTSAIRRSFGGTVLVDFLDRANGLAVRCIKN